MNTKNFLQYYKDCVFEDGFDSIFADYKSKTREYFKIKEELTARDPITFSETEHSDIKEFIINSLNNFPNSSFWYGYPTLVDKEKHIIQPVFFFSLGYDNEKNVELDINNLMPKISRDTLNKLGVENEVIKNFSEDINLNGFTFENNNLKNLGDQLLKHFPSLKTRKDSPELYIDFFGAIYYSDKMKYTQGLFEELNQLIQRNISEMKSSCLKYFISGTSDFKENDFHPKLYEIFELNENQKKTVISSFQNKVTVVTGPPGTGKSQVVASIIINTTLNNQKVLFASKNHKAVKVVEEKFRQITDKTFVIRLGKEDDEKNDLRIQFINYLKWLTESDPSIEITSKLNSLENKLDNLVKERDKAHKKIENLRDARNKINKRLPQIEAFSKQNNNLRVKVRRAIKHNKITMNDLLKHDIRIICKYFKILKDIQNFDNFESLVDKLELINSNLRRYSNEYLNLFIESLPSKLSDKKRKILAEFISVLKILISGKLAKKDFIYYISQREKLQKDISEFLTSWSVVNLSSRGHIPLVEGFFDVLIIDEASQCDIASVIPLLFRAKRVVVLGDPYQLKHITTMENNLSAKLLNKYEISPTFNYVENSFYDLAELVVSQNQIIWLKEHFRSHADIINFSKNYHKWYKGKLVVSTDYRNLHPQTNKDEFAIQWLDVKGDIKQTNNAGAYISEEINLVVQNTLEIIRNKSFSGTLGIVTPFRAQKNKIRYQLNQKLSDLEKIRVMVETIVKFQGDEKDIIIYSPVIANQIPKGPKFYLEDTDNLLNVAITRARAKLIIIGNKEACLNSDIQHYKKFAEYVNDLTSGKIQSIEEKSESEYEFILAKALKDVGLNLMQQYTEGQYRLDIAIVTETLKLDIEVDGKQFHTDWTGERLKSDIVRNQRLQNLGWKVVRFWAYEIRDSLDYCVNRVLEITND